MGFRTMHVAKGFHWDFTLRCRGEARMQCQHLPGVGGSGRERKGEDLPQEKDGAGPALSSPCLLQPQSSAGSRGRPGRGLAAPRSLQQGSFQAEEVMGAGGGCCGFWFQVPIYSSSPQCQRELKEELPQTGWISASARQPAAERPSRADHHRLELPCPLSQQN